MGRTFSRILAAVLMCSVLLLPCGSLVSLEAKAEGAEEEPVYMFNVIGDMQLGMSNAYSEENYKRALENIKSLSPESQLILSVGDQTNHSRESQYLALDTYKEQIVPDIPMYIAIGNHDRGYSEGYGENTGDPAVWKNRFIESAKKNSGLDTIDNVYYSFQKNGSFFIFLGSEVNSRNDNCNDVFISEEQFNWFKGQMEEAGKTGKPIFVVIHEPLYNTVSGSLPGQNWQGNPQNASYYPDNKYGSLKEVLDQYPSAYVFSGHTHWEFKSDSPVVISDGSTANYINCSSVGYLWTDNNSGYIESGKYIGSEDLYVYVYKDKVVVKGRDLVNDKWVMEKTLPMIGVSAEAPESNDGSDASSPASEGNGENKPNNMLTIVLVCVAVAVVAAAAIIFAVLKFKKK